MTEGQIPSVSPMDAGHPDRDAKATNANMATLRPKSKYAEGRFANPGAKSPDDDVEDLGGVTPTSGAPKENLGAKAAAKLSKDNSKSAKAAVAAETMKKLSMSEEIEMTEELEQFIQSMLDEGATEEEIAEAIEENFEIVSANDTIEESSHEEEEEDEKEEKPAKKSPAMAKKVDMKEHVAALLEGEALSEEFRAKAEVIFESAVTARVQEETALLEEAYANALGEEVANMQATIAEQVDDYLNYVVEQWIEKNEVAIETALRSELTEDFINGLRNLFAEHYIDIPESKVDILEQLGARVESLETQLNEEIENGIALKKMLSESKQQSIVNEACEGLTKTQTERLMALVEHVEFTTEEEYTSKIKTLKESYFPVAMNRNAVLDNDNVLSGPEQLAESASGPMAAYLKALGKLKQS